MDDADVRQRLLDNSTVHSSSERKDVNSPCAKHTAKGLMEDCPNMVALGVIDAFLRGVPVPPDASEVHATTSVAKIIHGYNGAIIWDDLILDEYLMHFEGWGKDMFLKVERNAFKSLKAILRKRRVYTDKNYAKLTDLFCNLLSMANSRE